MSFNHEILVSKAVWRQRLVTLKREAGNLHNLFIGNKKKYWNDGYDMGGWEFLESPAQRYKHYCISGVISERLSQGGHVLDVGCGYGTLYSVIQRLGVQYTGIDFSEGAIRRCKEKYKENDKCFFAVTPFEKYSPANRFDCVVLNEFLYYMRLKDVGAILEKTKGLLKDNRSCVIICMNKNPKSFFVWRKVARFLSPQQSFMVKNLATGSAVRIKIFDGSACSSPDAPSHEKPKVLPRSSDNPCE